MRNSSENRILETLPLFVLDRRDLFTIGTLEGRKLREPSKLGDNSDKLHPVTAARAGQKFLPRMFGWHGQKMSPSIARRIENLNGGRHRSSMSSVPRGRLGRPAPVLPGRVTRRLARRSPERRRPRCRGSAPCFRSWNGPTDTSHNAPPVNSLKVE